MTSAPWIADVPTALYRLYDDEGALLYIGITKGPETRWKNHAGEKAWWPSVARKAIEWYDTRALAEAAEVTAIKTERALYNGTHSPCAPKPRELDAEEVTVTELRSNVGSQLDRVRHLRMVLSIVGSDRKRKPQAALVPAELGTLIDEVGGPDKAAQILRQHAAA